MIDKPRVAAEYEPEQTILVRKTLLFLATVLGDLYDELVVVGGLVPTLLIPADSLRSGEQLHVGTRDLDIGLGLTILDNARYDTLSQRLKLFGFEPDINENNNKTFQRWKIVKGVITITVDFLIDKSLPSDKAGELCHLTSDLAAFITEGVSLAFIDFEEVELTGNTILDEKATRKIKVCGPGAFIVLKALAFGIRGLPKDAYDLYYYIRHYPKGIDEIVSHVRQLLDDPLTQRALGILRSEFSELEGTGPKRVALFEGDPENEALKADVVSFMQELVSKCNNL